MKSKNNILSDKEEAWRSFYKKRLAHKIPGATAEGIFMAGWDAAHKELEDNLYSNNDKGISAVCICGKKYKMQMIEVKE